MKDNVTISIFGTFVAVTKCGRYHHHQDVSPASLGRLEALIRRHRWHASFGGGARYYGPLQPAQPTVTEPTRWPGE